MSDENTKYPFSAEAAEEMLELYNIDARALYNHKPFTKLRILRHDSLATADYVETRLNIVVSTENTILDMYWG